jgi:transcription antitermination factor NusG
VLALLIGEVFALQWLVARVNPILERRAARQVARAGHLSFAPHYVGDGRRRALFPSYLFIRSPSRWYHLLGMDGIVGLVAKRSEAGVFRSLGLDTAVEKIMMTADSGGNVPCPPRIIRSRFVRGDRVRVVAGVFRDCLGEFSEFRAGRSRVCLASGAVLTLNDDDLAPLEQARIAAHNR